MDIQTAVTVFRGQRDFGKPESYRKKEQASINKSLGCGPLIFLAVFVMVVANLIVAFTPIPEPVISLAIGGAILFYLYRKYFHGKIKKKAAATKKGQPLNGFGLYLGEASGFFQERFHNTAINKETPVNLGLSDCCQNIVILGGIGSGKTTRVIQPVLVQVLDQDAGGLIFDIKGDFKDAVKSACTVLDRDIVRIGVDHQGFNLLHGLTPEVASSFLKSALILAGQTSDVFWIDTAEQLLKNSLGVLSFAPGRYNLKDLNDFVFDQNPAIIDELTEIESALGERDRRLLNAYSGYVADVFETFDEKVKAGVRATIAQVLSTFNHPDLTDTFCYSDGHIDFEDILNGKVFLLDLPLQTYGLGAKTVYTLVKLRFFNLMQQRAVKDVNQDRPAFFMCDEYQEIISCSESGLSDLNFWDKSRSSKTIGIISGQSISAFYTKGKKAVIDTILSNFRQKICFKTEDQATINFFQNVLGKAEVVEIRETYGENSGDSKRTNSQSQSIKEKSVITAQDFRQLHGEAAVATLLIDNESHDDVLILTPVFID